MDFLRTVDPIKTVEGVPDAYPDAPAGLSTEAAALDSASIWQRIEQWIAHRYTPRSVTFIFHSLEPKMLWDAPLTPISEASVQRWTGEAWEAVTLAPSPFGGYVTADRGLHQVTATVGADNAAPAAVLRAFARLAEYLADPAASPAGASSWSIDLGGAFRESVRRPDNWLANALTLSGAADLLRPYRRL
ncbi:MAG: hypothetical protein ACFE0P_00455 [Oceanicaulis sp.]